MRSPGRDEPEDPEAFSLHLENGLARASQSLSELSPKDVMLLYRTLLYFVVTETNHRIGEQKREKISQAMKLLQSSLANLLPGKK